MKLLRLRLRNYRGIDSCTIEPLPCGVTVVEGPNETGKSSLVEALRLLFDDRYRDRTTAAPVQETRPIGRDVPTEIEVDLDIAGRQVTFSRRFHRDRMTELRVAGQQALTGDEAHNAFHRILTERLDRSLWDALWVQQGDGFAQATLSGSRLLREALDAAASPSGPRDDGIVHRAEREYERYYTAARGQESGELLTATRALGDARRDVETFAARLQQIEDRAAAAARLEATLHEATASLPAARERAAAARAANDDLRERTSNYQLLQAGAREASSRLRELRNARDQRRSLAANVDRLTAAVDSQESIVAQAEAAVAEAATERDAAARASTAASDAATSGEAARHLAAEDFGHLNEALQLEQMRARYERATAARDDLVAARRRLTELTVDGPTLARLRELHVDALTAKAAHESAATTVEIRTERDMAIVVDGQPRNFIAGKPERVVLTSLADLVLPGWVSFSVQPAAGAAGASNAARESRERFGDALRAAGVDSLEAAEGLARERDEQARLVAELPRRIAVDLQDLTLDELAAKLDRQAQRVAGYRDRRPATPPLPADTSAARAIRDDLAQAATAARETARAAAQSLAEATRRHDDRFASLANARGRLEGARAQLQQALQHVAALANEPEPSDEELVSAASLANAAQAAVEEARAELTHLDPTAITAAATTEARALEVLEDRIHTMTATLERERGAIESAAGIQAQLDDAQGRMVDAEATHARILRRARAAATLRNAIHAARDATRARLAEPLRQQIQALGRRLYNDTFAVALTPGLTIESRTLDGIEVPFDQLSGGAREQLTILARVATAMLVDPGQGVPLIIDDALGYTDPDRLRAMGEVLALAGEHCQVVILTCYPGRYEGVAGAKVIDFNTRAATV